MNLSVLKLRQLVMEVRYPPAYRCFDHAGSVTTQILDCMPNWEVQNAVPNGIDLARPAYGLTAHVGLNTARVVQTQAEDYFDLGDGEKFYEDYLAVLRPGLLTFEIKEYTRIGFRTIFSYAVRDNDAAKETWNSMKFLNLNLPSEYTQFKPGAIAVNLEIDKDISVRFNIENLEPEVTINNTKMNWQSKKIFRLPSEKRKGELDAIIKAEKKLQHLPKYALQVDLDWSREDVVGAKPEDIENFVEKCRDRHSYVLKAMLG